MEKKKKSKIQQGMLNRYRMIFIIIALFAILIATMLFKTTVVDAPLWNEKAAGTLVGGDSITPERGKILASDGSILSVSVRYYMVRLDLRSPNFKTEAIDSLLPRLCSQLESLNTQPQRTAAQWKVLFDNEIKKDKDNRSRTFLISKKMTKAELDTLRTFAYLNTKNGRTIITAQALDCRIDGQHVGTFGDFGCFSFHSAKTMTTLGEGGMFVCADDADAAAAPGIRHNGCCAYPADRERYWSPAMSCVDSFLDDRWPQNFCIGEAQCALGTEELKSVIANNNTLIAQDRKIREKLAAVPEISFSRCPENGRYVVHQYIMHYDGSACGKTRDDLLDLMTKKYGIRCIVQYYPLYRYPLFQRKGCGEFDCPVLDKWWDGSFSFPWWCGMDDTVIDTLCSSLIAAVEELRG